MSKLVIERMKKSAQEPANSGTRSGDRLTKREQEILRVMTEGFANREIADKLFLSPITINTHRTNLTRKLNIYDTAGLVRFAISEGYVKTAISTSTIRIRRIEAFGRHYSSRKSPNTLKLRSCCSAWCRYVTRVTAGHTDSS